MNKFKFIHVIISCAMVVPAYAQEIPAVTGQTTINQLMLDSKALSSSIAQQKMALEHEAQMFSSGDQYNQLNDILNAYQDFIDRKGNLPEDKRRALDQIVDASAEVGHIRERGAGTGGLGKGLDTAISDGSIQDALDQNQQLLDNQATLLQEKNQQLNDFKSQLANIKNQLAKNNSRYADLAKSASVVKEVPKPIIKEKLVKEIVYQDNPALVQSLDQKSKELEDIKKNLSGFKEQLARNNRRYKEAVQESKVHVQNASLDQAGNKKLVAHNKKLQHDLKLLKEENVKNIQKAQQAAKEASVAKALAQRNLIDSKSQQLENYKNELNDIKKKLAHTNQQLEQAHKNAAKQESRVPVAQLNKAVADKENLLKNKNDLLAQKSTQLDNLKSELENIKAELSKTNNRYEAAIKEYQDKTRNASLDKAEAVRLAKQLADEAARVDDLTTKNVALAKTLNALDDNKNKLSDVERLLNAKDTKIGELKAELAHALEQNVLMHKQLGKENIDLNEIRDKAEMFRQKYLEQLGLVETKETDIKRLNDQIAQLPKTAENSEIVKKLKNQVVASEGQIQELRKELSQRGEQLTANKNELNTKRDRLSALEKAVSNISPSTISSDDVNAMKQQIAAAAEQIDVLKAQLKKDDDVFGQIKEKGLVLRNKIDSLSHDVAFKDSQIAELKLSLKKAELAKQDHGSINKESANDLKLQIETMAKEKLTPEEQATFDHLKKQYEIIVQNPVKTGRDMNPDVEALKRHYEIVVKSPEEIATMIKEERVASEGTTASQQELMDLKNEAKVLKETMASLKRQQQAEQNEKLTALQENINHLQTQLKKDDAVFAHIKDKGQALNEKISSLKNDVAFKDSQIAELKLNLKQSATNEKNKAEEAIKQKQQAATLKQQLEDMAKASLTPEEQITFDNLKKQYEIVVQNPIKNSEEQDSLAKEISRHYEIVVKSPQEIAETIKVNRNIPSNNEASLQELTTLRIEAHALKNQLAQLIEEQKNAPKKVTAVSNPETEAKLIAAQQEMLALKEQIAVLKSTNTEAIKNETRPIIVQADNFTDLRNQLDVSQKQFNELKKEILKNRDVINSRQDHNNTLQIAMKEQLGQLAETSATIKQKETRMALQETLRQKQQAHIDLLVRRNQLIVEYQNRLVGKLNVFQTKFNGATSDWEQHKAQYENQLLAFKTSIESMNKNNDVLKIQVQQSQKEKDEAYALTDRYKDRLKETADVNEDQSVELAKYRKKADALQSNLITFQEDMMTRNSSYEQTKASLSKLKKEHDDVLKELQVKDLSLNMAQASMQAKTKILQSLVDQLKDQIKMSDAQLAALRQQLKDAEVKVDAANRHEDLNRLKEMLKSSREEIILINNALKNKEQQVVKLQKDLQDSSIDFTSQHKAIASLNEDMDQQNLSIKKLEEDIDWKNKEISRLKVQLKEKRIDLLPASLQGVELVMSKDRKQISELTAQLEAAKAKIKDASTPAMHDPQGLRNALADAREQIATLKGKLNQKLKGLVKNDPVVIKMNKEVDSLRESLVDVMKENATLKDKNESIYNQMVDMHKDLNKCLNQIKALPQSSK